MIVKQGVYEIGTSHLYIEKENEKNYTVRILIFGCDHGLQAVMTKESVEEMIDIGAAVLVEEI